MFGTKNNSDGMSERIRKIIKNCLNCSPKKY